MNIQIKTKFIKSSYTNSPQINGTFGSLVKVLKSVLVDGFNKLPITKGTYDNSKKQIELFFTRGHGFGVTSVVSISGSSDPKLNKEFRVIESNLDSIILHSEEPVNLSDISNIKVKFAPLGYELVYDNITNKGTACFKSRDGDILKVIDAPLSGYDTSWTKYARVVAGDNIDTGGDFIDNQKFPKHNTYPNLEKTGNGAAGSGQVGYLSWEYARPVQDNASHHRYVDQATGFISNWSIIGDDRTFYLFIDSMGPTVDSRNIYTFGVIERDTTGSCILVGSDISGVTSNQQYTNYYGTSGRNSFTNMQYTIGCFINKSSEGNNIGQLNFNLYHITLDESNVTNQGLNEGNNPNSFYTPITVVDAYKKVRGNLRGIYQLYNNSLNNNMFLDNYKKVVIRVRYYGTDEPYKVPYLFSLEDW